VSGFADRNAPALGGILNQPGTAQHGDMIPQDKCVCVFNVGTYSKGFLCLLTAADLTS
jgi:hypothetical protein